MLLYSVKAEFETPRCAPTDCRNNNPTFALPICTNPSIFCNTFKLSPQIHVAICRKVRCEQERILRVTFQCALGIVIYSRKTIIINKKMHAFFLVCLVIVSSCIRTGHQHNIFGSKFLFFDKWNPPLTSRCERIPHKKRVVPHSFSSHSSDLSPLAFSGILYLGRHEFGLNGLTKGQKYVILSEPLRSMKHISAKATWIYCANSLSVCLLFFTTINTHHSFGKCLYCTQAASYETPH